MAWNVRRARYTNIASTIRDAEPDLLVLSETAALTDADRDLLGATDTRWR